MNDFSWQIEVLRGERQLPLDEVADHLNTCPMSYLEVNSPDLAIERLLDKPHRAATHFCHSDNGGVYACRNPAILEVRARIAK